MLGAAATLALAAAPGTGWTQTAPASEPAPALQEIVVTATRHEESLSKVPLSITALTQENMDIRGIKDIQDVAKFTPGVNIDNSGTNNISIRGIASTGGAGTTGIYLDDTPIQMRALAFNPDEALPKSFDIERVEVLRGPQGTLFGAGSEGGTVRYITTPPSLTRASEYGRAELSYTQGGAPSYEAGAAIGGPIVDGVFGARVTVWYRRDGGWIDRVDPTAPDPLAAVVDKNANHGETSLVRIAGLWAVNDRWTVTPSIYYQNRQLNDVSNYWPIYSNPGSDQYVSGNPTGRPTPDVFYLPALKIEGDFGSARLISNTSYYHRTDTTGYDGTLYNLGFYQTFILPGGAPLLLDGNGVHLPAGATDYRSPASVDNGQMNFTQEIRLQSNDPNARLVWTTGVFYSEDRQSYLEQIHDPLLNELTTTVAGVPYGAIFTCTAADGVTTYPIPLGGISDCSATGVSGANGPYGQDSYFLKTDAKDTQLAWFGEGTYALTDALKATVGLRFSKTKFSFETLTGGPQLFGATVPGSGNQSENSFTPKVSLAYQIDPMDMAYFTYAKGFRPGGANNPVPQAACATDFQNFGITQAPQTYNSDTVQSFEVGMKDNFANRVKVATSVYYIKWNNIQQTVIPPICQISWIQNLGQAAVKGADIQADIAVAGGLTAEIAAGYTDARYTKDSLVTPTSTSAPVVSNGDAIVGQSGQPGAPFTASVGLEYRLPILDHESFARVDYEYEGRPKWPGAIQDSGTLQYDAANYTLAATNFVTLRFGTTFGAWQVSAFVDNLTDTHTITNYNFTIDSGTGASRLERDFTFRPRTMGLTFIYRN
jgi:outer membrane receptor protein involved in Fe transport